MNVYTDFPAFRAAHDNCVATIGKYDGLHIGHQHVVDTLCRIAREKALPAVVILSEPHPEEFFAGDQAPARLSLFQDKVDFLLNHGVDAIYRMTFDRALCDLSAEEFIQQYLVTGLHVKALIVGDDFRFGKNRAGDFQLLVDQGRQHHFEVIREVPCLLNGKRVSSTLVREALQEGDCESVHALLKRYFSLSGIVIEGKKLGRELGTPTANLSLQDRQLPLQGIFSVLVQLGERQLKGVASAGFNPTVESSNIPKLEIHIFDFDEDIYGEHLEVFFVKKLRDEVTYPDIEALKKQIAVDIQQARTSLDSI